METLGSCNVIIIIIIEKNNQLLAIEDKSGFICLCQVLNATRKDLIVHKHTYAIIHCPFAVLIHMINCEKPN